MLIVRNVRSAVSSFAALALATLFAAGCGSNTSLSSSNNSQTPMGATFVVGTDAPMASVVSFTVNVGISATDANGNTVQLTSGTPTVDFARFNGLQTLIDMNDVPEGSYSKVSISLSNAIIGYLDTTTAEPTIKSMPATLSSSTVAYTLTNPMVVAQNGAPVGLHLDFLLRKSIAVDTNGQITGTVNPTFNVRR